MCGIAGIINFRPPKDAGSNSAILRMSRAIRHRGPDDEGYASLEFGTGNVSCWYGNDTPENARGRDFLYSPKGPVDAGGFGAAPVRAVFGHRRLSIVDLSPLGHQPMGSADGSLWIVFNGEIYNHIELKELLESKGHVFLSKTDTEVVIAAYREWGEDCVDRFNGMWAFALLDNAGKKVFFSRDRTGVKPLYYHMSGDRFVFASEIRAVLETVPGLVNYGVVWDYIVLKKNHYLSETFFDGILELEPARSMTLGFDGNLSVRKYWNPDVNVSFGKFDESEASRLAGETGSLVENAVRVRLRSDVPVGSCLSGGLDSSTIVAVANGLLEKNIGREVLGERQKTFTSSFDDQRFDERRYVRILDGALRISPFFVFPSEDGLADDLDRLVRIQGEPFSSTSIYAQYKVMQKVRDEGVKVLLDGQGGDELFGWYPSYHYVHMIELMRLFKLLTFMKDWKLASANSNIRSMEQLKGIIRELSRTLPLKIQYRLWNAARDDLGLLDRGFLASHRERASRWAETLGGLSLGKRLFADMSRRNLQGLLRYEDRNSMAFSIESRTPFADDRDLIALMLSVPSCYKVRNGWTKYLFRRSVENVLPAEICWRRDKMGFVTPEKLWIKNIIGRNKECLTAADENVFDRRALGDCLEKSVHSSSAVGENLWRPLNYQMWKNI